MKHKIENNYYRAPFPNGRARKSLKSSMSVSILWIMFIALLLTAPPGLLSTAKAAEIVKFPVKPVRLVLAWGAPGGASDTISRLISPKLSEIWGQRLIVDPRSGAGGMIGTEIVAKATPDGYTLVIVSPSHVINPALYKKMPFDSKKEFTAVSKVADLPNIMVINPSVPARTVSELVLIAKEKPRTLLYASPGNGSSQHLAMELFKKMAHVDLLHVPYKSSAPIMIDLIAGSIHVAFAATPAISHIRSGKLVALAVTTVKRVSAQPEWPTLAESGYPGYEAASWYSLLAPAGTPKYIVDKLQQDFAHVLRMPDIRERLLALVIDPLGWSPAETNAFMERESLKWAKVIRESGAKID